MKGKESRKEFEEGKGKGEGRKGKRILFFQRGCFMFHTQ